MMTYIGYTKLCKVNYCVCVIEIYILIIAKLESIHVSVIIITRMMLSIEHSPVVYVNMIIAY